MTSRPRRAAARTPGFTRSGWSPTIVLRSNVTGLIRQRRATLNQFWHLRQLADASYRHGGSPDIGIPCSIAWVGVSNERAVLSHPDMGERYFTLDIAGMDSDNFAFVGAGATGSAARAFAIAGPGWTGELPAGRCSACKSDTTSARSASGVPTRWHRSRVTSVRPSHRTPASWRPGRP